jgi:hypothetical protein
MPRAEPCARLTSPKERPHTIDARHLKHCFGPAPRRPSPAYIEILGVACGQTSIRPGQIWLRIAPHVIIPFPPWPGIPTNPMHNIRYRHMQVREPLSSSGCRSCLIKQVDFLHIDFVGHLSWGDGLFALVYFVGCHRLIRRSSSVSSRYRNEGGLYNQLETPVRCLDGPLDRVCFRFFQYPEYCLPAIHSSCRWPSWLLFGDFFFSFNFTITSRGFPANSPTKCHTQYQFP